MSTIQIHKKGFSNQLTENFRTREFDCKGVGCCTATPIAVELVELLQEVRNLANVPLNLNCAFRCPTHNAQIKGASKTSRHMLGEAADVSTTLNPVKVAYLAESTGKAKGLGLYYWGEGRGFVHMDVGSRFYRGIYTETNSQYDDLSGWGKLFVTLKRGSKGRMVKVLQLLLKDLGMYSGKIDKKFGPSTEEAVGRFQERYGLKNDFSFGPKCWEKMCIDIL